MLPGFIKMTHTRQIAAGTIFSTDKKRRKICTDGRNSSSPGTMERPWKGYAHLEFYISFYLGYQRPII
jgi:hypothetical protein